MLLVFEWLGDWIFNPFHPLSGPADFPSATSGRLLGGSQTTHRSVPRHFGNRYPRSKSLFTQRNHIPPELFFSADPVELSVWLMSSYGSFLRGLPSVSALAKACLWHQGQSHPMGLASCQDSKFKHFSTRSCKLATQLDPKALPALDGEATSLLLAACTKTCISSNIHFFCLLHEQEKGS